MANSQWYYAREQQEFGPVSSTELKQLAEAGDLDTDDLVWKEGMPEWREAGGVKGLFASQPHSSAQSTPVTTPVAAPPVVQQSVHVHQGEQVSVVAAGALNWLFPGIGYFIIGQWVKALIFSSITVLMYVFIFFTCGIGVLIHVPYAIFSIVDAVMVAQRINRGEDASQGTFF